MTNEKRDAGTSEIDPAGAGGEAAQPDHAAAQSDHAAAQPNGGAVSLHGDPLADWGGDAQNLRDGRVGPPALKCRGAWGFVAAVALAGAAYGLRLCVEGTIGSEGRLLLLTLAASSALAMWGRGPGLTAAIAGFVTMESVQLHEPSTVARVVRTLLYWGGFLVVWELNERQVRCATGLTAAIKEKLLFESMLKLALENSGAVFLMQDEDLRYRWAHNTVLPPASVLGRLEPELEGLPPEFLEFKRAALRDGSARLVIDAALCGKQSVMDLRCWRVDLAGRRGIVTLGVDVTELTRRKRQLEELTSELSRRVDDRTRALNRKNARLKQLTSDLVGAHREERDRLSRILHDNAQQLLVAAKIKAVMMERASGEEGTDTLSGLIGAAIKELRNLTTELISEAASGLGLTAAFEVMLADMEEKFGVEIERALEFDPTAECHTDWPEGQALLRGVREVVFNSIKHAGGHGLRVELACGEGRLRATIHDAGPGFPEDWEKGEGTGCGMKRLRDSLESVGGTMRVGRSPAGGALVELDVPLVAGRAAETAGEPRE